MQMKWFTHPPPTSPINMTVHFFFNFRFLIHSQMASFKKDEIDFDKLEKELSNALELDARYWRENDAKFRAIHQKVATYEEFR